MFREACEFDIFKISCKMCNHVTTMAISGGNDYHDAKICTKCGAQITVIINYHRKDESVKDVKSRIKKILQLMRLDNWLNEVQWAELNDRIEQV